MNDLALNELITQAVDDHADRLLEVSHAIHGRPELALFEELSYL